MPSFPSFRDLHERGLLFPLIVVLAVVTALVHGAIHRDPQPAAPTESPSPLLSRSAFRPELEKTPLAYSSDYWLQLGEHARNGIALLGPAGYPAVVVAPNVGLTSFEVVARVEMEEATSPSSEAGDAGGRPFRLIGVDADRDVALYELRDARQAFVPANGRSVRAGALVATISLEADGRLRIAPGHLMAGSSPDGELELTVVPRNLVAAAVVDLDGELLGVAVRSRRGGVRLLDAHEVETAIERIRRETPCRAVEAVDPEPGVEALLGARGLVVERVRNEAWIGEPPLRAGDVLLRFAGRPMAGAGEFEKAYDDAGPGKTVPFEALRGERRIVGGLLLPGRDCRPAGPPVLRLREAGLVLLDASRSGGGWRVASVAPQSRAERAGLERDDVLLAVNRTALETGARARLEKLEGSAGPSLLTVRRGARVTLLALPSTTERKPGS